MNIKLKVGHWYQLNNGEVHQCTNMDGPNTFLLGGWRGDIQEEVSREVYPKNLQELGATTGDVIICVETTVADWYDVGNEYTIFMSNEEIPIFIDNEGSRVTGSAGLFVIKSHTETKPKPWGKLTEAEQNEIAGHYARGGDIAYFSEDQSTWYVKEFTHWYDYHAYRIRPTPVTKTITMSVKQSKHSEWVGGRGNGFENNATHEITFNTVDGKPDCSTVEMVEL